MKMRQKIKLKFIIEQMKYTEIKISENINLNKKFL